MPGFAHREAWLTELKGADVGEQDGCGWSKPHEAARKGA